MGAPSAAAPGASVKQMMRKVYPAGLVKTRSPPPMEIFHRVRVTTPGSLDEALDALQRDHEFLLRGDVFTQDVVDTWISYKRENEADAIRLRPHPYEFCLYFDI